MFRKWLKNTGMHTLFVYGGLMRGEEFHDPYLTGAQFFGEALISGFGLYNLGPYSGIRHTDEPYVVHGELYEVNEETFNQICILEANGKLFQCEDVVATLTDSGMPIRAEVFVYLGKVFEEERISGKVQLWKNRKKVP